MTNITNLNTDIITNFIIPQFNLKNIADVHTSCVFKNININEMIQNFIQHDPVFTIQPYNVYNVLMNSSISVIDFDNIIQNIKKKEMIQNTIHFDMLDLDSYKIQHTITILKLCKKYCTIFYHSDDINECLVDNLMRYISKTIIQEYKNDNIVCKQLQNYFAKCIKIEPWENIDIDIYEYFKKCNLLKNLPISHHLKYTLDNQICINQYNNNKHVLYVTIKFLLNFFEKCKNCYETIHVNVYTIFELYKYMNYIEDSQIWNSPIRLYKRHCLATKTAAMRLKNETNIHYKSRVPMYLFNKFLKELDIYISR